MSLRRCSCALVNGLGGMEGQRLCGGWMGAQPTGAGVAGCAMRGPEGVVDPIFLSPWCACVCVCVVGVFAPAPLPA